MAGPSAGGMTKKSVGRTFYARELVGRRRMPWHFPHGRVKFPVQNGASYLVDPASSHMLVSKIKPCMSKYKPH